MATDIIARGLSSDAFDLASQANNRLDNLPKGVNYKGSVNYFNDLPTDAEVGDMYTVKYKGTTGTTPDEREFVWGEYEGTLQWNELGAQGDTLNVEDNVLIASAGTMESIEMNPTLSGTEQALTGIKVGDGPAYKVDSKLVEVTYGVTTYNEVKAIVNDGKIPTILWQNRRYDYRYPTGSTQTIRFSCNNGIYAYTISLESNNTWVASSVTLENATNKETTLTPSSTTKYPSSKAVADYVVEKINGVFELDGTTLTITTY